MRARVEIVLVDTHSERLVMLCCDVLDCESVDVALMCILAMWLSIFGGEVREKYTWRHESLEPEAIYGVNGIDLEDENKMYMIGLCAAVDKNRSRDRGALRMGIVSLVCIFLEN